jgi:hypothetical protein
MTDVLMIRRNLDPDMHTLRESPCGNSLKMQPYSSQEKSLQETLILLTPSP